jgi:hypothetical protein
MQDDQLFPLGAVSAVVPGRMTAVMKRSGKAKNESKYWSIIVNDDVNLNLESKTPEERDFYVTQFNRMIEDFGLLQRTMMFLFHTKQWVPPGHADAEGEES